MKRPLKILAVAAAVVALTLGGLAVFIKVKFPPEKIKNLVQEQVKARLHRELKLGDVALGLWCGVSLKDVTLSERPDFAAGTFLSARSVSVEPFLLPLLRGNVVIKRVALEKPAAAVIRFPDGRFNFSDLSSSTAPAAAGGKSPVPLLVNSFSIHGGDFSFDDRQGGLQAALQDFSLQVDAFSFTAPFSAGLAGGFTVTPAGKPGLAGKISFKGRLGLGGETADIQELLLTADGASLQARGTVKNFSAPQADIRLVIDSLEGRALAPFLDQPLLKDLAASGRLRLQGGLEQLNTEGDLIVAAAGVSSKVSLKVLLKDPASTATFSGSLALTDLSVSSSPLAPGLSLNGGKMNVSAKGGLADINADVQADLGAAFFAYGQRLSKPAGAPANLAVQVTAAAPFDQPLFDAKGDITALTLASGPPFPPELALQGPVSFSFTAKGTPQALVTTLSLDCKALSLSYADLFQKPTGAPLSLQTQAAVKDQKDISFSSLRLTLAGIAFNASGKVSDAAGQPRLNLALKAAPFDVAPLGPLLPSLGQQKLSGRLGFDLTARGPAAAPTINGVVNLRGLGATPMPGFALADLTGDAGLIGDSMSLSPLTGKLNGEAFSLKMFIKHLNRPEVDLEGTLSALDLGKLQAAFTSTAPAAGGSSAPPAVGPPPLARTQGSFRLGAAVHPNYVGKDFRLAWNLANVGPDLSKLNGTVQLSAADGRIHDLPLADKINALLKRDAADITYSKLGGHMVITNGVLSTQDFAIDSQQMDIAAQGKVNLVDMQSDLRAVFKLAPGAVRGAMESYFADENGRVTVEASIQGPLTNPTIRPDLSKAAATAAKKTVDSLLKKALGGKGTPSDPNAPATDPNQQLEDAAKKALQNIFKKKK